MESPAQIAHQARQFFVGKEGRRTAPEVQLRYRHALPQFLHMQGDFLRQGVQIAGGAVVVAGHHLVTGAVITDRFAEGDVDVERQRLGWANRAPLLQRQPVVLFAEAAVVAIGGGIRRVSRPVLVQPGQQLRRKKRLGGGGRRRFQRLRA
ncbi:hypothetical protein D3C72_1331390 [compost metagenome]